MVWNYLINEVLRDGAAVTIRAIRPDDRARLARHFEMLSADSLYRRFFGLRHNPGPQELDRLTMPAYPRHVALVATIEERDGEEAIIGDARYVTSADHPEVAELALSVVDAYQGRGVGALLAEHLQRRAREAGVHKLTAEVLASNLPAMHFLIGLGFRTTERSDGVCSMVRFIDLDTAAQPDETDARAALERRAYYLYLTRGAQDGRALDDWLDAERVIATTPKVVLT